MSEHNAIQVSREQRGEVALISLSGRLDSTTSQELERNLMAQIDQGANRIAINVSALDYISSAGLRVLLVAAKRIKAAGGALALGGMQSHIQEVFEISGFLSMLTVLPDVDAAVASVKA